MYIRIGGPSHLDVRLADGGSFYGRVEVYDGATGVWGTVCGNNWDVSDAQVVGRQLGIDTTSKFSYLMETSFTTMATITSLVYIYLKLKKKLIAYYAHITSL